MGVGVSCYIRTPWYRLESNQRHTDFQSVALPTELRHLLRPLTFAKVVGERTTLLYYSAAPGGLEPP